MMVKIDSEVKQLTVREFLSDGQYVIPIYQRNYDWGERETLQLLEDVSDYAQKNSNQKYYIGSAVVFVRNVNGTTYFEMIDGQQRLTTLTILASLLKHEGKADWFKQPNLSYEHRKEADEALRRLQEGMQSEHPAARNIVNVYALLKKHLPPVLEAKGLDKAQFADYLFNQVKILRIPLPHDTQLNHYFEIMNTRGEQLEKHEVLKATLMSKLQPEEHSLFHWIWEACADMNSYVQMNFSVENRTILFGKNWRKLQFDQFDSLREALFKQKDSEQKSKENSAPLTLNRLFEDAKKGSRYGQSEVGSEGTGEQERFGSIINFPNFLLQVLKVCYHRSEFYQEEKKIDKQIRLDDKGLIPIFETVLQSLVNEEEQAKFVKFFIIKLLFLRTQYDRYVIKREEHNGTESWSLKTIQKYDKNKVDYVNTFSDEGGDAKAVQLLEAMFHVSAPTQIYKHWLNALLYALFHAPEIRKEPISASDLRGELYNLACSFMLDVYLAKEKTTFEDIVYHQEGKPAHDLNNIDWGRIDQGCSVHNFIFNFYDFITWQNDPEEYSKFDFSYRTSVEHFYPQKPMKGYDCLNEDVLHSFGNLCLISSSMNSKFSNNMPKAKLANFGLDEEVRNGLSLKLLEMMDVVKVKGDWSENEIKVFNEEAMRKLSSVFQEALSNQREEKQSPNRT
jgi:hypothetical protein